MLIKYAEEIKNIRLSKDLTLQQVSIKTRIDYKFLEAMEAGDFEYLPEIYVKAFLKEYLKILDVDQDVYLKKYEAAKQGKTFEVEVHPEEIKSKTEPVKESRAEPLNEPEKKSTFDAIRQYKNTVEDRASTRKKTTKVLYYIGVVAVFIAAILYLFFFSGDEDLVVPEKAWEEVIDENGDNNKNMNEGTSDNMNDVTPVNEGTPVVSDSLRLTIKASDTSWIKITFDDSRTEEFILFPGSQKSLKAVNNYKIIFGNAGGILLDLNGQQLQLKSGSPVQRVKIDSNGISELEQGTGTKE